MKHKRSDWMEGLLLAEKYKSYSRDEVLTMLGHRDFIGYDDNGDKKYVYTFDKPEFMCGVTDYLNHKKYLESLDKND